MKCDFSQQQKGGIKTGPWRNNGIVLGRWAWILGLVTLTVLYSRASLQGGVASGSPDPESENRGTTLNTDTRASWAHGELPSTLGAPSRLYTVWGNSRIFPKACTSHFWQQLAKSSHSAGCRPHGHLGRGEKSTPAPPMCQAPDLRAGVQKMYLHQITFFFLILFYF